MDTSSNTGFVSEIIGWAKQPFNAGGSAFNWILFVGLLIIAAWMWHVILLNIQNEL